MERNVTTSLIEWLDSVTRKPLVLRGARQVGKTWLIRNLAKITKKQLIEVNFEKQPALASLFESNDPQTILLNLSTQLNEKIIPEKSLLFLDEIQSAPELLSKLRWFAEDLPQLPVVAAGSLLEFVLSQHAFSMPVGRISYMHVEPLSFEEFLSAKNKKGLIQFLENYAIEKKISKIIHEELMEIFKEYILVGGMPAVIVNWIADGSFTKVNQIQHDLLATYRDDFNKYKGRIVVERLDEVMMSIPKMLGQKFVYSRVNSSIQAATIKNVLSLLEKARICHRIKNTAANGVPLAAEIKDKNFKEIFLDIGLCGAALGLNLNQINAVKDIAFINHGGIAEQVVGQLLRTLPPVYMEPELFYWQRENPGANAEIDYIIQYTNHVIPVEVKAGSSGTLKSLHLFMSLKKFPLAVRINSDYPSKMTINQKNTLGDDVSYNLISIPFYLIGQLYRLLSDY